MSVIVYAYVKLASAFISTTYGYGEMMCGDTDKPQVCSKGAITASGVPFEPDKPTIAVPMPANMRLRAPLSVSLYSEALGECVQMWLTDKKNAKFIGNGGLDLSPGALKALGIKPSKHWSGRVELCTNNEGEVI